MKRQPLVSQGSVSRMIRAAAESWERQEFQESIDTLERAGRLDPANATVLLNLGRVYGMRYEYAAAERCFEKAARVGSPKTDVLALAAVHCRDFRKFDLAAHYLALAVAQPGATPDTFVKLAEMYERLRRPEEAAEMVDRALHLDSKSAFALLAAAHLDRLAGRLDDAERRLRSFLTHTDPENWGTRVRGWYELGGVLDRQGRYDEAMAAFLGAKSLLGPVATQHAATLRSIRAHMNEAKETIPADALRRWFDAGETLPPRRRLALLCGHPRSGTTLLEQVLDSHPDIVSAEETDILNFDAYVPLSRGRPRDTPVLSILDGASPEVLRKSRADYFRFMEMFLGSPIGARLLIDKNPSLTVFPPAVIRLFPEIKFLVALRDPRDVCLSCFMQPLPLNPVSSAYLTLEGTVMEYTAVMGLWRSFASRMPNPRLEVRYEDLVDDLASVSRHALEFLGIGWDDRVLRFDEHARGKVVRSPTYVDVAKPLSRAAIGRWRNYRKYFEPLLEKLAPLVKACGYE